MPDLKIGNITHYYDKIGVAVVDLLDNLTAGENIKIVSEDSEFEQKVSSMQIEHNQINSAKKGQTIGLKVEQPATKNSVLYKVT
jgi:U32 family peptidase